MPHVTTDDGVRLHYEEAGSGTPVVFVRQLAAHSARGSALVVVPRTGHALNLEEPAPFNRFLDEFFHQVEAGRRP